VCRVLSSLAETTWNASPAAVAQRIHRMIRAAAGDADPYRAMKERMNRTALDLYPSLRDEARMDEHPRTAVVCMAIAGNLMDAGAKGGVVEADMCTAVCRACREWLTGPADALFNAAARARQILYLADNAGEIVFDRALIEALPRDKMIVGVRGAPVLNDATLDDAGVAGLPDIVRVVSNGSDAPGTIIEDCSEKFRAIFETSDLVIAKGQGNYESLAGTTDKHVFFLLRVKCGHVAAHLGTTVGSMVICEHNKVEGSVRKPPSCVARAAHKEEGVRQ
jgi:hypothetical protein